MISNRLLPDHCFGLLRSTVEIVYIKRGVEGYYPLKKDGGILAELKERTKSAASREEKIKICEDFIDELNRGANITAEQRMAMEAGSMFGWNVPGADPNRYIGRKPRPV